MNSGVKKLQKPTCGGLVIFLSGLFVFLLSALPSRADSVSIFQYGIFYQTDLEICNEKPWTIDGRVFCNRDIYFKPSAALSFSQWVAGADNIFTYRQSPADPVDRSLSDGTVTYDNQHLTNVARLYPAVGIFTFGTNHFATQNYSMLAGSAGPSNEPVHFFCVADLIVLVSNQTVTATSGYYVDNRATVISPAETVKFIKPGGVFYNARENKNVHSVTLDIGKFHAWSATNESLRPILGGCEVRSIYIADLTAATNFETGIVLTNGAVLPSLGLGIATPNPAYIVGDWNVSAAVPSAIYADAVTVLSSNWRNARSTAKFMTAQQRHNFDKLQSLIFSRAAKMNRKISTEQLTAQFEKLKTSLGFRLAASTTVNAALMAGNVPSNGTNYSGGAENFIRLLEDWAGESLTFNGSIACMFDSQIARGPWRTNGVYTAPVWNWLYDENLATPSGAPPMAFNLFGTEGLYPMITRQPTNVVAAYGSAVSVTVPIFDLGFPVTYQWSHFGVSIASATNSTLVINPFTVNDAGNYQLTLSFDDASVPARGFTITSPSR